MRAADVSIGAAGTTAWERCALGWPAIVLAVAENQREGALALKRSGAGMWLGDADQVDAPQIARALEELNREPHRMVEMSRRALDLMQGGGGLFGTNAVVQAMDELVSAR